MFCRSMILGISLAFAMACAAAQTARPATREAATHASVHNGPHALDLREDWTVLPLAQSGLDPDALFPVVLATVDKPTYTRQLVRMQWRNGDPIEVTIVRPKGVAKAPVILYLYDYTSDTTRFQDDGWCQRATQGGFAAVGFVSALSGQRFHSPRPMKEWFVSEMQEALATSVHDVQKVLNYVATQSDLDAQRVGMFGQGSGGAIAILAAATDSRITALDVLNPWGDWPAWVKDSRQIPDAERAEYLKPEFLESIAGLDPVHYLPRLASRSVRLEQMMEDSVTPAEAKEKLFAAAPQPANVIRYKNVSEQATAWRANGLTGWLKQQLHAPAVLTASAPHTSN